MDQEESQFFVQLGIDENQDPEALHQLLMDVNISAGERALIQRRLLNRNKPKTAGAQRNMGKKKLSTVRKMEMRNGTPDPDMMVKEYRRSSADNNDLSKLKPVYNIF